MVQFKPYFLQQKQLEAPYVGTTDGAEVRAHERHRHHRHHRAAT